MSDLEPILLGVLRSNQEPSSGANIFYSERMMKKKNRDNRPMGHIAREWLEVQLKASKEAKRASCVKMYERHLRQLDVTHITDGAL